VQDKVLLTGATGFLGSWVARTLVEAGMRVRVLVRRPERLRPLADLDLDVMRGDVLQPDSIDAAAANVDAIVHCAGDVSWRRRDGERVTRVNVEGTRNVLQVAQRRALRLLHTSSTATIGPTRRPQLLDETSPGPRDELDFAYPASKRASERLVLAHAASGGDAVVLNPGIIYGPGDAHGGSTQLIARYVRGELTGHVDGGASYCDVRDAAAAYVGALRRGRSGERYILAGVNRSHAELRAELQRLTGLPPSFLLPRPLAEWWGLWSDVAAAYGPHPLEDLSLATVRWGALFTYCSSAKAERELAYRARDFTATLRDTIVDLLRRGVARPITPELRRLLHNAPRAAA
jgi:dihydroflavonol-4-reductase